MIQTPSEEPADPGALTVAVLSAGDTADVTARLRPALAEAGLIATPDVGRLRTLAATLGVALVGRVISWAGSASPGPVPDLLAELLAGQDVLLVTEAATGGADAAVRGLITAVAAAGLRVTALPGPSPITAALAVAGLPADRFTVEGAPPPRAEVRERRFAELAAERRTLIFVESPGRLGGTLAALAAAFGADRPAVLCQALGSADQDIQRGTLGALAARASGGSPGNASREVTVVVAGAPAQDAAAAAATEHAALEDAVAQVQAHVRAGATTRDAVAAVAAQAGLRKRDLYNAASRGRKPRPSDDPPSRPSERARKRH
jgi:16S rRNA (cytidine1402-2'-O)-methyltransferase